MGAGSEVVELERNGLNVHEGTFLYPDVARNPTEADRLPGREKPRAASFGSAAASELYTSSSWLRSSGSLSL